MTEFFCQKCGAANPINAIYCKSCRHNLREALHSDILTAFVAEPDNANFDDTLYKRKAYFPREAQLYLKVVDFDDEILCDLSKGWFTLGRKPQEEDSVHIDFSRYDAADTGVSRLHARITRMHAVLLLEDLGTLNGTYVNRERISAIDPCVLCNGDDIHLGNFRLKVEFR
ncbi:MAG TPA: FHA domain-containing protein [Aggregatilineales bacterium]|nr:FHA domain-containing protein [Aggregatilineales bacterium]